MAIKLRRLKNKCVVILTVLGVMCAGIGIGLSVYMQIYMSEKFGFSVYDFSHSYQETDDFKTFMEKRLAALLSMGVEGRRISVYSLTDSDDINPYFESIPSVDKYQNIQYMAGNIYNKAIRQDKNIVYAVICEGKIKYSNYHWEKPSAISCPSGYNYEFRYKNGSVSILRDGVVTDVYEDEYYSGDSDWYVPGYKNFQVTENIDMVEVVIYAIERPMYYEGILERFKVNSIAQYYNKILSYANVGDDAAGWFLVNELYRIDSEIQDVINTNIWWRMLFPAGIIFLAAAFFVSGMYKKLVYFVIHIVIKFFDTLFQKDSDSGYTLKNKRNFLIFMSVDIMTLFVCTGTAVMTVSGRWNIYAGVSVCAAALLLLGLFAVMYVKVMSNDMSKAVDDSIKNERMKVELVTNVSHDIKTPLTSIISYIKLLKEEELPDYVMDYVNIIDNKSERLKSIVADVFDISKASSGQLPVDMKVIDFGKLILQTVADMEEAISRSEVIMAVNLNLSEEQSYIMADGNRLYRVIQNLIQNALLYSLPGSRVHISLSKKEDIVTACIANTSKNSISDSIDFTERFVRGDSSRSDGGSGLGLSIAKSFTEACGGTFKIETYMDMFIVKVSFHVVDKNDSD